jgi:tetratricopeptide (TPR) repeat protein
MPSNRISHVRDLQASDPEYLGNQALIYLSQGNLNQAIEYQQQSLSLITVTRNNRQKARAKLLLQQGIEKYHARQFEAALQSMKQALAIYQELNERQEEGVTLGYIGNVYYIVGDYDKATESQQRYLTIAREFYDRIGEAQALGNIGINHKGQGDYHSAIYYIEKYLEMALAIKDRTGEQQALANLGNAYCLIGDCVKAIDYHQDSLALAREIKDRRGEAQALGSLGTAHYVLGDLKRAIDYLRPSLTITREIQDPLAEGQALNNLGLALLKSGNFTEAERTLRTGIQVWESLRAGLGSNDTLLVSFFETQISTYILLQKVLITQNKLTQALEIAERGRARAFVELLARRNTTTSDSAKSPIAPPTIKQLQQIAKQQNATLVEYSIINDDFKIKGKQKPQESELYTWVISPTGEITFRSSDLQPLWQKQNTTLADLVTVSRESIHVWAGGLAAVPKVDQPTQTNRLQQLHQILIQPIADLLPTNPEARVIFMPQSSLFLVPFPALQDEQRKYLIEKHTILTAPSIQVLKLTRKQRQRVGVTPMQGKDALVVGNPIMPSVLICRLPRLREQAKI